MATNAGNHLRELEAQGASPDEIMDARLEYIEALEGRLVAEQSHFDLTGHEGNRQAIGELNGTLDIERTRLAQSQGIMPDAYSSSGSNSITAANNADGPSGAPNVNEAFGTAANGTDIPEPEPDTPAPNSPTYGNTPPALA